MGGDGGILLRRSNSCHSKCTKSTYPHEANRLSWISISSLPAAQICPLLSRNRHQIDTKKRSLWLRTRNSHPRSLHVLPVAIRFTILEYRSAQKTAQKIFYANFRMPLRLRLVPLRWTPTLRPLRAGWIKTSAGMSSFSCRLRIMLRDSGLLPRITSYTRVRWPMTPINALESLPFCSNRNLIASMGSGRSMG